MEDIMKAIFYYGISKSVLFIALIALLTLLPLGAIVAQEMETIKLPEVNKNRGSSLMEALSKKASAQNWSDRELSMQDLSDLLWAAAGINRPDSKKRTYSSAMNTQDVEVYVFLKDGVYLYDFEKHALNPVISGDHRADISASMSMGGGGMPAGGPPGGASQPGSAPGGAPAAAQSGPPGGTAVTPPAGAGGGTRSANFPVDLLLVSDPSKYRAGSDDLKKEWGAFSAGIITQNVMLFCSANDLGTRPRASFDKGKLKTLLKLKDTQNPVIELPIGYLK